MSAQSSARSVEIWFVDLTAAATLLEAREAAHPCLSAEEVQRASAITSGAEARDLWRQAHIALRLILERWLGPSVRQQPYCQATRGKPALAAGRPFFSLAHSGQAALIAISELGSIGVDLEAARRLAMPDDRRQRLEATGQALAPDVPLPADCEARALQAWVRFEAAAKVDGEGIGPWLSALRADTPHVPRPVVVRDLALPEGFRAAVAAVQLPVGDPLMTFPVSLAALESMLNGRGVEGR